MAKCRWPDGSCRNEATKVIYRMASEEEQKFSEVVTDYGAKWTGLLETNVCDTHLEAARKEYPHIANKEPQ
ncbi:MAG: hypothetical protein ABR501_14160 [Pyrinomonadaceae bacterium]